MTGYDCEAAERIPVTLNIDLRDLTILTNGLHNMIETIDRFEGNVPICGGCQERMEDLEEILLEKIKRIEKEQGYGRNS